MDNVCIYNWFGKVEILSEMIGLFVIIIAIRSRKNPG